MMLLHGLIDPFLSFGFMRRALMACLALSLSAAPLGVFLLLRRMSLVGDALSHAVLPGAAIGYLISGMSLVAMVSTRSGSFALAGAVSARGEIDRDRVRQQAGVLERDLRMAIGMLSSGDFAEGVRAVLIDRTNDAAWRHPSIAEVPADDVKAVLAGERLDQED